MKKFLRLSLLTALSFTVLTAAAESATTEKNLPAALKVSFKKNGSCHSYCEPNQFSIHVLCLHNDTKGDYSFQSSLNEGKPSIVLKLKPDETIIESICFDKIFNSLKAIDLPMVINNIETKVAPRIVTSKFYAKIEKNISSGTPPLVKCYVGNQKCMP
ncbi:hypothetical protein BH10PSE19_BH10PSE19_11850 [soil metagenome]